MRQNPEPHREKHGVGNDRPWLLLKTIDAKSPRLYEWLHHKLSAEPCSSLLTLAATNSQRFSAEQITK